MIELKSICKKYCGKGQETLALNGIDLRIDAGEMTAIMGTSGSGKTTLLNIIGGMDTATSGEYLYMGDEVTKYSPGRLHLFRKQNVSFVFQSFALMERYTVYENVEMPLRARGVGKRKDRIMECLKTVGMEEQKKKLPSQLSGGQRQRCAIARALAADTPLLLADEPTGSLDRKTGRLIMDYLCGLNAGGKTIIVVTHDLEVASRCRRLVRIEDGVIIEDTDQRVINEKHI